MKKVAILYQAHPAPSQDGVIKPMKKGGYSDSGADLAVALKNDYLVITPKDTPNEQNDLDWVFPDTEQGIQHALDLGAQVLWLNTVLYRSHPIIKFVGKGLEVVGQKSDMVDTFDNKWTTNQLLKKHRIPIPKAVMIDKATMDLNQLEFSFPVVLKPIRGRGSQGVQVIESASHLESSLEKMFNAELYGSKVYIEPFLSGNEITVTVMPPGTYFLKEKTLEYSEPWCLPPIHRYNHKNGIAPYSGEVPVVLNSRVLTPSEISSHKIQKVMNHCITAATLLKVTAPIRIDCRADHNELYYLFDLNLKPNMTGNIRKERTDQNSLSSIAAAAFGWSYTEFTINILEQKWAL
ncbi:ATP-grasp domain-containing protein [Lutimonas sp.]|uniref:ATP-grasp domain-containing protein n=1 Tax=Lutimonas sp. TaxID=1872403 RepID=UPI003D9BE8BE